jgi:asparagine synthase (glutamine-hydrolysing)
VLDRMTDRLAHRGPDARGTYLHQGVGFGHRRLSIVGLSDGLQPMSNEDQTIWATYNGEIYNYQELKAELSAAGHIFKTGSDTEVLLHGYEQWGRALLPRLRGIYAFAIHDQQRKQILCSRDRLGVKPFYYLLTPELFLFASEPKALLLHPAVPRRPDLGGVHLYLRYGYVPAPFSSFEGIRQLEPGQILEVDPASSRSATYWEVPPIRSEPTSDPDDRLDQLIDDSVGSELMSEVPLGAMLSGGIDSSTVVASMSHLATSERPKTFCIGFPVPEYDESGHSRRIADLLALDHHVEQVGTGDLDLLDRLVEVYDEPFSDASAIPTFALSKMTQQHVLVALSGDGGDELFAGYRRYQKVARYHQLQGLPRQGFRLASKLYPAALPASRRLRALGATLAELYDLELSVPAQTVERLTTPEVHENPGWDLASLFRAAPADTLVGKAQWVDLKSYLPGDILVKVDRASMAHGLEVRVPLLDHHLVEWALKLPTPLTFGAHGEGKVLLKRHLARRLPKEAFDRPKMGFGVPLEHWLRGEHGLSGVADRLRRRHPRRRFFSPLRSSAIERLVLEHRWRNVSSILWALLFLEAWWQKHFV